MIYGYIRVSSDKQTVENQRFEINNFCNKEKQKHTIKRQFHQQKNTKIHKTFVR